MMNEVPQSRVLVLGGGIAGLATALELLRRGLSVTLLEKSKEVGGLARTYVRGDFRFDVGGHRFHSRNPAVLRWVQDLMGDDLLIVPRRSRIWLQGKFVNYPIQFPNALTIFTPPQAVRILASYLAAAVRRNGYGPDVSFEDWVVRRFGRALYEVYFKPYTEKVWGIPCTELSADWAAQRISLPSLAETVRRGLVRGKNVPATIISEFRYPRRGFGMIPERMAQEIGRLGGEIRTGVELLAVKPEAEGFAATYRLDGETRTARAERLVSSIPLDALLRALPPETGAHEVLATYSLRYRDIICLFLAINKPQVSPDSWTYFPQKELLFGRSHEPRNWSREMVPPGMTSLGLEVFTSQGEPAWNLADEVLVERAVRELAQIGWLRPEEVVQHWVLRVRYAYPVYDIGYAERLRRVKEWLGRWPRLHLVGRTGSFRYMNSDGVIEDALALVDFITQRKPEHVDVSAGYRVD
jgi:protoporphyrinogen oxidase